VWAKDLTSIGLVTKQIVLSFSAALSFLVSGRWSGTPTPMSLRMQ
jgi:hypothetical protein